MYVIQYFIQKLVHIRPRSDDRGTRYDSVQIHQRSIATIMTFFLGTSANVE
jgi:hypothetical protein